MTINKIEASDGFLVWHFVRVVNGEFWTGKGNLPVVPGQVLRVEGKIVPCVHGLHGSERALDALQFAPGTGVERAFLRGDIIAHGGNKHVASERLCLWVADASRALHEFMLWCGEEALALVDNPDPRSVEVLAVKRRWLAGEATDAELKVARSAAHDVYAAYAAADPYYDTVAADALAAAYAVVHDAAYATAYEAATAFATTYVVVGGDDAIRDRQNAKLEALLMTLAPQEAHP